MVTVKNILGYLETLAPTSMKESWDNVGFLLGKQEKIVNKILVALDPFPVTAQEAVRIGADLLVTHHPIFFSTKAITDETPVGLAAMTLLENGISSIHMHTNLDSAPGGVNDVLAAALGLQNVEVLVPAGEDYGLGRYGQVKEQSLGEFCGFVKEKLGCHGIRFVDGGKPVTKVAVGGGSCGDFIGQAISAGCDTFVTADVKYNQFADAKDLGLNLIDAGHFATENLVCDYLAEKLAEAFPQVEVVKSQDNQDVIQYFED